MIRLIKLIIWITIIFGGIILWNYYHFQTREVCVNFIKDGHIIVEKGESFHSVLTEIFDAGLLVRLYLKQYPPSFDLQAGKYESSCWNIAEIIESLKKPINETDEQITFLEWWNIYDIDRTLTNRWLISSGEFISYVTSCDWFCSLKADYPFISDAENLEGFLYPDTYNINPNNFSIQELVRKMLARFQQKVIDAWIITDMGSIEILDIINMASIVQKETAFKKYINGQEINKTPEEIFEEAATVAGVLKKRLNEWWQIWADATVCYAHEIGTQECTPNKVLEFLYDKNDYNTRQMVGLPVWPIANPQDIIIEATINSKSTPYYYYLHAPSGQIYYWISNADHERNKDMYLR